MVDLTFDCREDARGRDPDSHSPTLRRYHQLLWSKSLPCGKPFHLDISGPKHFLVHRSELGEFHLASDAITHTYAGRRTIGSLVPQLPQEQRAFALYRGWPISECIVFPGRKIDGRRTINAERGMTRVIGDRFDLTLECIRRHYAGGTSPLADVMQRYRAFFALFGDFQGYLEFFLLQDLVDERSSAVRFYLPFDEFRGNPLPQDTGSYLTYIRGVQAFAAGRARRIEGWCNENLRPGPEGFAIPCSVRG